MTNPLPRYLREQDGAVHLSVKVQPRASVNAIGGVMGDFLKVRVTAPPVDSAANEAVLALIAESLGCRSGDVALVRGLTSRQKVIRIAGLSAGAVARRLQR